jgi:hypothetical protein
LIRTTHEQILSRKAVIKIYECKFVNQRNIITGICSLNLGKINVLCCIVLCMNVESTIPSSRQRNRWQDAVREDVRTVGGEEWQYVTERNGRSR